MGEDADGGFAQLTVAARDEQRRAGETGGSLFFHALQQQVLVK